MVFLIYWKNFIGSQLNPAYISKFFLLMFKCLYSLAPLYLTDNVVLLDRDGMLVHEPRYDSRYGDRSFSYSGPRLWNSLPQSLRKISSIEVFKSQVKHYLFDNFNDYLQHINRYREWNYWKSDTTTHLNNQNIFTKIIFSLHH